MKLHQTYEFGAIEGFNRKILEPYLKQIWKQKLAGWVEDVGDDHQGLLQFDGTSGKVQNFVGFIQTENDQVEIYPKVFRNYQINRDNIQIYQRHLFFWFDYCRKWKFPFSNVNLNTFSHSNLPELIISMIGQRFYEVLNRAPISLYEEMEASLQMPRGRINVNRYVSRGLATGNHHIIECDLEPLQYDNRLNKIIKYVTRLLLQKAKFRETKEILNNVLFLLDEVEDVFCTSRQLDSIRLNSFYTEYQELIDLCRLVLNQQIYSDKYYEQRQWSLLLPMEYIFEDFVAGFLEKHFSGEWKVEYQKSDCFLTEQKVFQMQHDIFLTYKSDDRIKLIVDTKYKLRSPADLQNKKKGISQSDLYQMTSYAFRRGCNKVVMLYPNYSEELQPMHQFTIKSGFAGQDTIKVIAAEVPFWCMSDLGKIPISLYDTLNSILIHLKKSS